MRFLSSAIAMIFALGPAASAETQAPAVPTPQAQTAPSKSLGTAARDALTQVKSARANLLKKDYSAAELDIGKAQSDLKTVQSNPEVNQLEGLLKSKEGGSPVAETQKQLGNAQGALSRNQPQAADSSLKKAEGLLASIL